MRLIHFYFINHNFKINDTSDASHCIALWDTNTKIIQMMMPMIKMMHLRWWLVGIQYNSMNNPGLVRQGGRSSSHLCNSHTYLLTLILPSSKYISNKKNTNQNKENTKTNKKNTNPNKKNTKTKKIQIQIRKKKTKKKNAHNPHSLLISTSIPVFPPYHYFDPTLAPYFFPFRSSNGIELRKRTR